MGTSGPIPNVDRSAVATRHDPMSVELSPSPAKAPRCPRGLGDAGKRAWKTFWGSPVALAMADVDHAVLERLCQTYDRLQNPELADKDFANLSNVAMRLETALGITAGARARLGIRLYEARKTTLQAVREGLN